MENSGFAGGAPLFTYPYSEFKGSQTVDDAANVPILYRVFKKKEQQAGILSFLPLAHSTTGSLRQHTQVGIILHLSFSPQLQRTI